MAVTLVSLIQFGPEWKPLALDQGVFDHFWTVWRGLCVTMLLVIAAQYQDRLRSEKRAAAANHTGD